MNQDFKIKKYKDATVYTLESASGGGTSAGAVASVSSPFGGVRKRGGNLIAQENDKKAEAPKPRNFVAKNAKMGGAGAHKDKKKAAKHGDVQHRKPFAESQVDEIFNPSSGLATFLRGVGAIAGDLMPAALAGLGTFVASSALIGPVAAAMAPIRRRVSSSQPLSLMANPFQSASRGRRLSGS